MGYLDYLDFFHKSSVPAGPSPVPSPLPMVKAALEQYGISGQANAAQVLDFAHKAGLDWYKDTTTPWCGVFMTYLATSAGFKDKIPTNPAHARSWLAVGTDTAATPALGDVCVFYRGPIDGTSGHVTMFLRKSEDGKLIYCLGGNQGNQVCVEAFNAEHLLGIRRIV